VNIFTKDLPSDAESVEITILGIRKYIRAGVEFPAMKVSSNGGEVRYPSISSAIEFLK
jgi:hypothetical protein